eukprot:GHVO01005694.1.p1 GENE.GHVO01005694.1~~GHVO01005694.1.p1  ORF type:complete len:344 (+),score=82.03 GHVO01005694.1:261-1292(+)
MRSLGALVTAAEMFESLCMWESAIDCLIASGKKSQAMEMVKKQLSVRPTPSLWCSLGDLENSMEHYTRAWEESGHRLGRAKRSEARIHFRNDDLEGAARAFETALAINPLHAPSWFALGCAYLRLSRFDKATTAFGRYTCIDHESHEAWGNLAAAHAQLENWREAHSAIKEAVKRHRNDWRLWQSALSIYIKVRAFDDIINGLRNLIDIGEIKRITVDVWALVLEVIASLDTPSLLHKIDTIQGIDDQMTKTIMYTQMPVECCLILAAIYADANRPMTAARRAFAGFMKATGEDKGTAALKCASYLRATGQTSAGEGKGLKDQLLFELRSGGGVDEGVLKLLE